MPTGTMTRWGTQIIRITRVGLITQITQINTDYFREHGLCGWEHGLKNGGIVWGCGGNVVNLRYEEEKT